MTEFQEEFISDVLQSATVLTVGAAAIQLGPDIPVGFKRKITRVHVPSDVTPLDIRLELWQGDAVLDVRTQIDEIVVVGGNPDYIENAVSLRNPLMTIRPNEVADPDEGNRLYARRVGANNGRMSIQFYDER